MAKTDASFATLEGSEHSDIPQPVPTLGTAIDSVSSKLTSAGMALHFPVTCHSKRQPGKPSGTVIRLPTMILLGITHFREISNAKDWSIGELADYPGEALVPGNVVALYDIANRCFLRVWNDSADYNGGWKQVTELSLEMDSERFLVVDAGAGCIALYNPRHRRFLCCQKDGSLSAGQTIINEYELPRANECFEFKFQTDRCERVRVSLFCPFENKSVWSNALYEIVQVYGFDK